MIPTALRHPRLRTAHLLRVLPCGGGRVGVALVLLLLLLLRRHPTGSTHHTLRTVSGLHSGAAHPGMHALGVARVLLLLRGRRPVVTTRPHLLVAGVLARVPAWVTWVVGIPWPARCGCSAGICIGITNGHTWRRTALRAPLLLLLWVSLLLAPKVAEVSEPVETREVVAKEVGEVLHHWDHRSADVFTATFIRSLSRLSSSLLLFSRLPDPLLIFLVITEQAARFLRLNSSST